jgi:serine/arginine repetitive matrix protein 2
MYASRQSSCSQTRLTRSIPAPSPAPTETYRRKSTESATLLRNNSTTSSKFLTPDYQPSTLSRLSDLTHPSGCHPREAELAQDENKSGSLALRAMRSVKSMARMGSWAQLRSGTPVPPAEKEKEKGSKRVKEKKEKKRKGIPTMKSGDASGSSGGESWLVGAPSHAGSPNRFVMVEAEEPVIRNSKESTTTMASQSSSSSQDYGTRRASTHSASTFSSSIEPASSNGHSSNGHSSNSSGSYQNQIQQSSSSRMSSSRSKQSSSTLSGLSIMSSLNSTVKAPRTEKGKKKEVKDTREREDARRRGSLANVFELAKTAPIGQPIMSPGDPFSSSMSSASFFTAVEEAMPADDDNTRTRPARPRPMSEQLLRPRPKGIIPNDGEDSKRFSELISQLTDTIPQCPSPWSPPLPQTFAISSIDWTSQPRPKSHPPNSGSLITRPLLPCRDSQVSPLSNNSNGNGLTFPATLALALIQFRGGRITSLRERQLPSFFSAKLWRSQASLL